MPSEKYSSDDRRRVRRGTPDGGPGRAEIVARIVREYRDMPGLSLDLRQAARLFSIGRAACSAVLGDLVRSGQLRVQNGQYRNG